MGLNLFSAIPEIFLTATILVLLLTDAWLIRAKNKVINAIAIFGLVISAILQFYVFYKVGNITTTAFNNMFILDGLAQGAKIFTYLIAILLVIYNRVYLVDRKIAIGEFYAILLFAILGMQVMISANNMLVLYVGLELLSLALYGLVALNNDNVRSIEAAMKFFILGALGSGILLYGISFVYGATGGMLQLDLIAKAIISSQLQHSILLVFGLTFIVAGLCFKLGMVPFHMWVPDVYEGSSLAVTNIIGSITKIAGVIFVIRFLVSGFIALNTQWSQMLLILAIASLFIGNIVAIKQTNIKRMLGYSTITHMGFIALALMLGSLSSLSTALFYLFVYVITALVGFATLTLLSNDKEECENLSQLRGLASSHPIYAAILLLVMFSLAGIPPLAGFYAKFKILEVLVFSGYIRTAIFAVIMSLIGAFYYLRVVKTIYFDNSESESSLEIANWGICSRSVLVINALAIIVLGVMPQWLLSYCDSLIRLSF